MMETIRIFRQDGSASFLELGFEDLPQDLWIKNVEGLGVKQTLGIESGYFTPGGYYAGVFNDKRNVVLTLGYGTGTLDRTSLRRELFSYFVPGQEIKMEFYSAELEPVYLMGHVETAEAPLFGKNPDIQISVVSDDPSFYALTETVPGGTLMSGSINLPYTGGSPVGFTFDVISLAASNSFGFYRNNDTAHGIHLYSITESIKISTVEGARGITLLNSSTSRLKLIEPDMEWPKLLPGDNSFSLRWAASNSVRLENFRWRNQYGGI